MKRVISLGLYYIPNRRILHMPRNLLVLETSGLLPTKRHQRFMTHLKISSGPVVLRIILFLLESNSGYKSISFCSTQ